MDLPSRKRIASKARPTVSHAPANKSSDGPPSERENEIGREIEKQAKIDASAELELLLSDPDKLSKVSQIRLEQEEKLRVAKANLKNLVKTTTDETEAGLENLNLALEPKTGSVDEVKEFYWEIKGISEKVSQLIPKEHYQLILSVDVAIHNLERTKCDLKRIMDTCVGVKEIETLLKDDEKILLVHEKLRVLEATRTQILEGSRHLTTQSHVDALFNILNGVTIVSKGLDLRLKELIQKHFYLIELNQQTVLLKCLQIIHREKRIYDHNLKVKEAEERNKRSKGPSEDSKKKALRSPLQIDKKEIECYEEKAKEWIIKGINLKFDELLSGSMSATHEYIIQDTLDCIENHVVNCLTNVFDRVRPCFPPYLNIFGMYCSTFHKRVYEIYTQWANSSTITPPEIIAISKWARKKYQKRLENIGCDPSYLKPSLTTPLQPLYEIYTSKTKESIEEHTTRIISVALESKQSHKIQQSLYLAKHLFILIEDQLSPARATNDETLFTMAIQSALSAIETFQAKWAREIQGTGSTFELWFIVALLCDFDKCRERTEKMKEQVLAKIEYRGTPTFVSVESEWTQLILVTRNLGVDFVCHFLKDEFNLLFGANWLMKNRDESTGKIIGTLRDDFEGTIKPLLVETPVFLLNKMANDTLDRVIFMYIEAMYRPHSFSQRTAEVMTDDIFDIKNLCITVLGISEKLCSKRLAVLEHLRDLISVKIEDSGEPQNIQSIVEICRKEHSDMTEDHMMFIIRNRDDLDDTQIKRVAEAIKKRYRSIADPPTQTTKKWFDKIALPSNTPEAASFGRSLIQSFVRSSEK